MENWKFITAHTRMHAFNGPLSGTTRVRRYQKGKANLNFTEARDSEWQWHQLGCMQICTSLQTDNHASNTPLSFHRPDALPAAQPTASEHGRYKVHHSNRHKFSEKLDDSVACLDIAASRDLLVCHMLSNHLKLRLFNVLSLSGESQKMLRQLQWTYPSCKVLLPTCPCWRQPVQTKKAWFAILITCISLLAR